MRRISLAMLALACVFAAACTTTTDTYIQELRGYAVTRCEFVQIRGLCSDGMRTLGGGVAVVVSEPGCQVDVSFGSRTHRFDLEPGSILLHSDQGDYLLQLHQAVKDDAVATPAWTGVDDRTAEPTSAIDH